MPDPRAGTRTRRDLQRVHKLLGPVPGEFAKSIQPEAIDPGTVGQVLIVRNRTKTEAFGPGDYSWVSPITGTVTVQLWGPGASGGASSGGGGGGGGFTQSAVSVTADQAYAIHVSDSGELLSTTFDVSTVIALAGSVPSGASGGSGATTGTGDTVYAGAVGGDGDVGGGGGGSSAGTASNGSGGSNASGDDGGAGGTAPTGGGDGGAGGNAGSLGLGMPGASPGGGGGGSSVSGVGGGEGGDGRCVLTYTVSDPIAAFGDAPYTPTTTGDWTDPDPTTMQQALDRCAAAIKAHVGTGP
jgi:hypothetical protein